MENRSNFERIKCSGLLLVHSCKAGSAHGAPAVARAGAVKQPTVATTGANGCRTGAARRWGVAMPRAPLALLLHAAVEPLLERGGADVAVRVTQVELAADLGSNLVCRGKGGGRGGSAGGRRAREGQAAGSSCIVAREVMLVRGCREVRSCHVAEFERAKQAPRCPCALLHDPPPSPVRARGGSSPARQRGQPRALTRRVRIRVIDKIDCLAAAQFPHGIAIALPLQAGQSHGVVWSSVSSMSTQLSLARALPWYLAPLVVRAVRIGPLIGRAAANQGLPPSSARGLPACAAGSAACRRAACR